MNRRQSSFNPGELFGNPILVGSMILIVTVIGVLLSYNANKGLPYVPAYQISAIVPDAAELTPGGSEVRIGGARIGIIKEIEALPATPTQPARARLYLELQEDKAGLPVDSEVRVRPRSILGAKYLDVIPGKSSRGIPPGGSIPIEQAQPIVELDEAFNVFDDETSKGIRSVVTVLGDALAGRGADLNETVAETAKVIPPAQRVLAVLADPDTRLDDFVRGLGATSRAIEPVAPRVSSLLLNGARTLQALDAAGPELEQSIEELPRTERAVTSALRVARPVLDDATAIATRLRPGAALLPRASQRLADAVRATTPVVRRVPDLSSRLRTTLLALERLARNPSAPAAVRKLTTTVETLDVTLQTLLPAQKTCNILGLSTRNLGDVVAYGNVDGSALNALFMLGLNQQLQSAGPADNLHANPTPNNNARECESGNEPYLPGRHIGNPPGLQPASTELTQAPASATRRARAAGLLKEIGR
ncbi:MlaD family protein [Paraconexibacter sp.]|uniref:MlaD family protein n=1 Tax=Paraconexibacter sp. TaxID=2949640 RepID=UPI0035697AD5